MAANTLSDTLDRMDPAFREGTDAAALVTDTIREMFALLRHRIETEGLSYEFEDLLTLNRRLRILEDCSRSLLEALKAADPSVVARRSVAARREASGFAAFVRGLTPTPPRTWWQRLFGGL